ncbi:hypothetical protein [Deinococcus cellulosilyticus]|uniref:Uncharacterized protein n=1 Tax=Deinococcus cellulosilyticus (strain DSM 18568 / NBRC 106333 / KACC 11606 / 5516J-15) TaxID=1223518 RepID=A0A511MYP4_DEIC1|nr:hypothetical protein [Deinococcus cellulosilyticus]GEM45408.1 hypothetical protein DC3_10430 [Deinococcus cellulosilyticus NBRC 106333 = KACC 11606]
MLRTQTHLQEAHRRARISFARRFHRVIQSATLTLLLMMLVYRELPLAVGTALLAGLVVATCIYGLRFRHHLKRLHRAY